MKKFSLLSILMLLSLWTFAGSIDGIYKVQPESYRIINGRNTSYNSTCEIVITDNGNGTYHVDDLLGGWYSQRVHWGPESYMSGTIAIADDGTVSLVDSYVSQWGDSLDGLTGSYDTASSTFTITANYVDSMQFVQTWVKDETIFKADGINYSIDDDGIKIRRGAYSGAITIPNEVTYNGISYKITSIGEAFNDLNITSVSLPSNITSLGRGVFRNCYGLTSVNIPSGVTIIDDDAFEKCTSLPSIDIPNSVTSIGNRAFINCESLATVTIPNSVTTIGYNAFLSCCSLRDLVLPINLTTIDDYSFVECNGIKSLNIPKSLTEIGEGTFTGCAALETITVDSENTKYDSRDNCNGIIETSTNKLIVACKKTVIPQNVTIIGSSAFQFLKEIATFEIPSSVTNIENGAFLGCTALKDFYIYAEAVPTTDAQAFFDAPIENATLHVPFSAIDAYRQTAPWNGFGNIEPMGSSTMYTLTYKVDDTVYKTYEVTEGDAITPEAAPTKEGYTFSGWSEIPSTMPANDVTVTGSFTVNKYKLTYQVDGETYKTYDIEYGAAVTPEAAPTKEGYTFSGWSEIPSTMPANDVTITGTFVKKDEPEQPEKQDDKVTTGDVVYEVDGNHVFVSQSDDVSGDIKIEATIVIGGKSYEVTVIAEDAFKGCAEITSVEIPNTVVSIGENAFVGCTALRIINIGKGILDIASKAFANIFTSNARTRVDDEGLNVYCLADKVPATAVDAFDGTDIANATLHVPEGLVENYKATAPWSGFGTIGSLSGTGINAVIIEMSDVQIFDMQGNKLDSAHKGINIIRTKDGQVIKVIKK